MILKELPIAIYRREVPDSPRLYVPARKAYPQVQRHGNRHYTVNQRLCRNARNGAEINGDYQRVAILAHLSALAKRYERFMRALRESRTDQRNRSGQYRA